MSIEAIAATQKVRLDTVESYLAECITAGFGYDWQRMGIPDAMRDRINFGLRHFTAAASSISGAGEHRFCCFSHAK